MNEITAVIPAHNEGANIAATIASLRQQTLTPGRILVVSDNSTDDTVAQAEAAGFDVVDEFSFGLDYARTLRIWRDAFLAQEARVLELGFDKRFIRIWEFYLCYCEAAFSQANTSVMQFTLRKR